MPQIPVPHIDEEERRLKEELSDLLQRLLPLNQKAVALGKARVEQAKQTGKATGPMLSIEEQQQRRELIRRSDEITRRLAELPRERVIAIVGPLDGE